MFITPPGYIRYLTIMKVLYKYADITDPKFLKQEIELTRGKYNSERSFTLKLKHLKIRDSVLTNTTILRRIILKFLRHLPKSVKQYAQKFLGLFLDKPQYEEIYQKMPVEMYLDMEAIDFCGISVNAPKERVKFLETVYGKEWRIPKINFIRSQMNNLG